MRFTPQVDKPGGYYSSTKHPRKFSIDSQFIVLLIFHTSLPVFALIFSAAWVCISVFSFLSLLIVCATHQARMSPVIFPRQDPEFVEDGHRSWWYSQTASIVKWSILAGIVLFFMAWFLGGYWHARMRIRKGLPLMKYHRVSSVIIIASNLSDMFQFLVPDHQKQKPPSALQNEFSFYRVENEGYQMDHMQPPPPPPGKLSLSHLQVKLTTRRV